MVVVVVVVEEEEEEEEEGFVAEGAPRGVEDFEAGEGEEGFVEAVVGGSVEVEVEVEDIGEEEVEDLTATGEYMHVYTCTTTGLPWWLSG